MSGVRRSGEVAGAGGPLPTVVAAAPLEQRSSASAISPSCYLHYAVRSLCVVKPLVGRKHLTVTCCVYSSEQGQGGRQD